MSAEEQWGGFMPTRVLVVDPSRELRDMFCSAFQGLGCELLFANDGFQALGMIDRWRPSVVFANALAARVDGYTLARVIRRNSALREKLPIILLASSNNLIDKARSRFVGAQGYLVWPLHENHLREAFFQHA